MHRLDEIFDNILYESPILDEQPTTSMPGHKLSLEAILVLMALMKC